MVQCSLHCDPDLAVVQPSSPVRRPRYVPELLQRVEDNGDAARGVDRQHSANPQVGGLEVLDRPSSDGIVGWAFEQDAEMNTPRRVEPFREARVLPPMVET
jgi:hypothetical protein